MKNNLKRITSMIPIVVMLLLLFSFTTLAAELTEVPAADGGNQAGLIDIGKNGDYVIELVNPDQIYEYKGEEICPEFKVFLRTENKMEISEECYTVEYSNNVNAGTGALITVIGVEEKGYTGTISKEFTIEARTLKDAEIALSFSKAVYTGKAIKPEVTVTADDRTLVKETDYTVTYSNNVEIGSAEVIVTGKGNYTGTKEEGCLITLGVSEVSSTTEYNKVTLNWERITGATGYIIQRSNSENSGFSTIKKVTNGSVLTYTDSKVSFNGTYYYRVRAYRTVKGVDKYSDYSAIISRKVRPAKVSGVKVARVSYTSLKLTWSKVNGASGYNVYRSTSKDGEYKYLRKVNGSNALAYTDKDLECGRTYYYKVRAYRTIQDIRYLGEYSSIRYINTRPQKVAWDTVYTAYNSTYIELKWKKTPGAVGYQIYRATSKNGTYKVVKTLNGASTLSWKNTGLTKGKVYYYKIRAYCIKDGTTIYGPYSNVYTKNIAGWKYSTYDGKKVKLYYNNKGQLVKDVSNLIGKQSSYMIKVNKRMNTVTVYAKDGKNGYIIPVKAFVCSTGAATPLGTYKTPQKLRWQTLDGPSYGQWCTRITGHFLFHSVWYYKPKNTTLSVAQYNKLGTQASHGCIRLSAGDAKWIYDNCKLKTTVTIYNSNKSGPLGKPKAYKLKSWHTWDPTDPNVKSKCAKKGCH